jgi:polysaccharide pyruvyl transferase WcaK-like protein
MTRVAVPATIGLLGNFGTANLGNEGTLQAMLELVARNRPLAKVVCICRHPEAVEARFGVRALGLTGTQDDMRSSSRLHRLVHLIPSHVAKLAHAFRAARLVDVIVIPGTGILDDYGERASAMPLTLLYWCVAAAMARRPVAFVAVGAGPIRNAWSRRLFRAAIALSRHRSYRDQSSKDFLTRLGVDTSRDAVLPDLAFSLAAPDSATAAQGDAPTTVGVGVMAYYGWHPHAQDGHQIHETYVAKLTEFVVHLLKRGHRVRLIIGSQSDNSTVDDIRERVKGLMAGLAPSQLIGEGATNLQELMAQIAATDIVVATRFHNIVCALKMGKPTISLGYALKNDELLRSAGLADYHQPIETFTVETLMSQFERISSERARLSRRIAQANQIFARELARYEADLVKLML